MFGEGEAWSRICGGDGAAFDGWYRQTAPRLRAFLRHVVGNAQAAEDVMQETYTNIWRRPEGFDPERGSLSAYLFGVARRQAAEWRRRQKPTEELEEDAAGLGSGLGSALGRCEERSVVADAFGRLNEEQKTLLWLREVEGQSYAELAAILEVPLGTVRSRLFAAREALREIWNTGATAAADAHGGARENVVPSRRRL